MSSTARPVSRSGPSRSNRSRLATCPGEWYAPTQPIPTRPPAYDRQGITLDDLIDFTPELRAEAEELVSHYQMGPIFTPPVVSRLDGPLGTLMAPAAGGGTNWPGRLIRPGHPHPLCVVEQLGRGARADAALPGAVGHGLHPGERHRRSAHERRRRVVGWRWPDQL